MRLLCLKSCIALCLILLGSTAGATHIVGGEISYEDLGDGEYRIRLVVYRDCGPSNQNGTGFDDAAIPHTVLVLKLAIEHHRHDLHEPRRP